MKKSLFFKMIALVLMLATLMSSLPISIIAAELVGDGAAKDEVYIKSVKLVQAKSIEDARVDLAAEEEDYILLEKNLNEGTDQDGIWLAYLTTTDPTEAIYDMKVMNMNGGFTLTSLEKALEAQTSAFAEMAKDLEYLLEEFAAAYSAGEVAAEKAYKALNFFRMVEGETELLAENGLGYQIVNGGIGISTITEILMLCNGDIVDSIVKMLAMGIQGRDENWMQLLSEVGPYDADTVYMEDEDELNRRAEQLLLVMQLYSEAYNTMVASGLMPDDIDKDFNAVYHDDDDKHKEVVPADKAETQKLDESRFKFYKIVSDELAKYSYGSNKTLKDFFISLEEEGSAKKLYPLVSVLSDGEFAALSYGCFLEVATGAFASDADFDAYDEVYETLTSDVKSLYLYAGVDKALLDEDTILGFTDEAQRHMAATGEMEFYEKTATHEQMIDDGIRVAKCVAAAGMALIGVTKIAMGTAMIIGAVSATASAAIKTGILAGAMKLCAVISGPYALLVVLAAVALVLLTTYIVSVITEYVNGKIDWDANPMPEYLYDVKEVTFSQTSSGGGVATEFMTRPVFVFYEAVTDLDGELVDLNARSKRAEQWIELFVSYDRQGENAKPIKAEDLLVKYGSGETPEGYSPVTCFGQVIAYDLNQWDETNDVNGVYLFYKQDQEVSVDSGKTYYIYDVYLQVGESPSHCIGLLEAAGYTPLNVNLSPDLDDDEYLFRDKVYTYLGYKVTANADSAIRDIRMIYGPSLGEIRYGSMTYAECGSNGSVTLYASKYSNAGTPLLAGGLACFDDKAKAPAGYEPVCTMAGGPAVSFNTNTEPRTFSASVQTFLYFLPETTFTSGTQYVGDLAFFFASNSLAHVQDGLVSAFGEISKEVADYWSSYTLLAGNPGYMDAVMCYTTYNPYRAVYGLKGAKRDDLTSNISFEGLGYVAWNRIVWNYQINLDAFAAFFDLTNLNPDDLDRSIYYTQPSADMNGAIYVTGNPDSKNVYDASKHAMSNVQPLALTDIICWAHDDSGRNVSTKNPVVPDTYKAVVNVFANSEHAARIKHDRGDYGFDFYVNQTTEAKPYVSNIYAIDELTLFRAYGGHDKGLSFSDITESMMLTQLAAQGATSFNSHRVSLRQTDVWDSSVLDSYDEINALMFGYKRVSADDKNAKALRDIFLYFDGFSNDEPPKELYRGSVKYTLLCEIPYNLTGYDIAPKTGVYLYGTTDSKAGNRIIDFEVSATPFMSGYETVRTMNGRSLVAEIKEYSDAQKNAHPMSWAVDLYKALFKYFDNDDGKETNAYFYLHIKREGDELSKQKPYIGELYATYCDEDKQTALDQLFDQGAEGYVDMNLNEGSGGDKIYLGYSYTADPDDAIREIRAYHKKNPPATLTDDDGRLFYLDVDVDLNRGADGDYIYLYSTKDASAGDPIASLSAVYKASTSSTTKTWVDGTTVTAKTLCTKKWDSGSNSDLNKGAGGKYIYLLYTVVGSGFTGTYKEPSYGKDKTYTRAGFTNQKADGKYIGGIYVMDKNTILQEKIAAGTLKAGSDCSAISDDEVIARLKQMGATEVLDTPIGINNSGYFKNNTNKTYIGYSRTDKKDKAIKNLAIKIEVLSLDEPKEKIEVNKKSYSLVAEAASKVAELPKAVNLLCISGGEDLLLPKMYLYYSTANGSEPIYDLCIDDLPLLEGWNTVRSATQQDPFADVYYTAYEQYELANKDDWDFYDSEIVYTDQLFEWMDDVAELFDPENAKAKPFYIHVKRYAEEKIEDVMPYIGELFIGEGDSRHEALSKLIAFEPDGFVDCDMNRDAGGNYVYLAYKRVAKATDALTDIMVYQGKKFEPSRRLLINDKSVKFTLVADIDLNHTAGGKYLYLYTTDSKYTGNPITSLEILEKVDSYLKCGVERVTVKRADGNRMTTENIDLNKGAGGDYLYLIMIRETTEGHRESDVLDTIIVNATCGEDGHRTLVTNCLDCGLRFENVAEVYKATGEHVDKSGDGDHKCDVCGLKNFTEHISAETPVQESRKEATATKDGYYYLVYYCTECEDILSENKVILPAGTPAGETPALASLFGGGSVAIMCTFAGLALLAAAIVLMKKRKTTENGENEI